MLAMTIIAALTFNPSLVEPQSSIFSSYLNWNNHQNESSVTTDGNVTTTTWVINYVWDCGELVVVIVLLVVVVIVYCLNVF